MKTEDSRARQSLINCLISVREESSFFLTFNPRFCHPVQLFLSLLGSQSYLGCCYRREEPFLFFTWFCLPRVVSPTWAVVIWRQNLSFFNLVLSLLGCWFILDCAFLSYNKLILSMNSEIIKFTCLDRSYFFLCRFNIT